MFEFFIALFGGTYFGHKYAKDKYQCRNFDNTYLERNIRISNFKSKVVDEMLESELYEYVRNKDNKDAITKELYTSFQDVFGSHNSIFKPSLSDNYFTGDKSDDFSPISLIVRLLMANRGKVRFWEVTRGIPQRGTTKDEKIAQFYYMYWVNAVLRKNGIGEPILFCRDGFPEYGKHTGYTLDAVKNIIGDNGVYGEYVFAPYCPYSIVGGRINV